MLFDSWSSLLRVLAMCVAGYAGVILFVRAGGKRSLSKLNAYDVIINVAMGSILATLILSTRVPLVNGLAALGALIALQTFVAWLAQRSKVIQALVKASPAVLYEHGELREETMRNERINEADLRSAVRMQGKGDLDEVDAVVLEPSGDLAVIGRRSTQRAPS